MQYKSGAAFRRALEVRLLTQSFQSGVSLVRLRKLVAFDRFLARLLVDQPGQWILKGGLALQLRIGSRARTTKDMDLLNLSGSDNLGEMLSMAGRIDLGDWFAFEIENQPTPLPEEAHSVRYPIHSLLDGREFESFHVDIAVVDPVISPEDVLMTPRKVQKPYSASFAVGIVVLPNVLGLMCGGSMPGRLAIFGDITVAR